MAALVPGITRAGEGQDGVAWNILGHRYWIKAECEATFCFETLDPPGTFVPQHIHPTQDEFIHMLDGILDLQLGDAKVQARAGDLVVCLGAGDITTWAHALPAQLEALPEAPR